MAASMLLPWVTVIDHWLYNVTLWACHKTKMWLRGKAFDSITGKEILHRSSVFFSLLRIGALTRLQVTHDYLCALLFYVYSFLTVWFSDCKELMENEIFEAFGRAPSYKKVVEELCYENNKLIQKVKGLESGKEVKFCYICSPDWANFALFFCGFFWFAHLLLA